MSLPRENKKSFRLRGYDYSAEGAYFITICTYKKERHFGKIVDGEMQLNGAGKILKEEWLKTSEIRENLKVYIDEFCVMPNHFHAIIIFDTPVLPLHNGRFPFNGNETTPFRSPSQNLSSILRGFKASCTKQIRKIGIHDFRWQKSYHDHIVRDYSSLELIRKYILNNPVKWQEDELFSL